MLNYYMFDQNNSGGSFGGPAEYVYVEAETAEEADAAGQLLGLYFDGVTEGRDCGCCGNRWYRAYGKPETADSLKALVEDETEKLGGHFRKNALFFLRNGFAVYVSRNKKDDSVSIVRVNVPGFTNVPNMLPEMVSEASEQKMLRGCGV